jgi:hypothetical protein
VSRHVRLPRWPRRRERERLARLADADDSAVCRREREVEPQCPVGAGVERDVDAVPVRGKDVSDPALKVVAAVVDEAAAPRS